MFPYQKVDITPFKRSPEIDEAKLQKEFDRAVYPTSRGQTAMWPLWETW